MSLHLDWKYYNFSELTDIPSPHGRPGFYHFGTLGLCFLCMGLLCVKYQTGLHSPALRTGYDGLRRLYGIPTLPALCDPFCSHGVIFNVWPHITLLKHSHCVSYCLLCYACSKLHVDNSLSLSIASVAMLLCIKSRASMHKYLLMHCVIVYEYLM